MISSTERKWASFVSMRPFLPSYLLAKHLRIVSYNYSLHSTDIKDTGFWLVVFANHEHLHREPHWHSSGPGFNFRMSEFQAVVKKIPSYVPRKALV